MSEIYYFAYGSNMNPERMKARKTKYSSREKACLKDHRLTFNKISQKRAGEGFANILYEQNSVVEGILYRINNEGLGNLDMYENYPHSYRREVLSVLTGNLKSIKAQVYIANNDHISENLLPDKSYVKHLLKAGEYLSPEYYEFLLNHPTL